MIRKLLSLVVFAAAVTASSSHAEIVKVGRTSIELPEGTWKALTASDGQNQVNGNNTGALPTETRAFAFVSDGRVLAVLNVNSSKGAGTRVAWSNTCTSNQNVYSLSLTENPNAFECARASVPLKTESYLKVAVPEVLQAMESSGLALPPVIQTISATVGNSSGTMLHVNLIAVPTFAGLQGEDVSGLPARVKPGHVAWARQLALAAKGSVYSMSGNMTLPPVAFAAPRVTSSTPQ